MKNCKGENCENAPVSQHSKECLFEHFLCYTGSHQECAEILEKLKKAYFDGLEAGKQK